MAAKRAADIVPLAHSGLGVEGVKVGVWVVGPEGGEGGGGEGGGEGGEALGELGLGFGEAGKGIGEHGGVRIVVQVECTGKTGVEMEALAGVMGAALSVVDMCKGVDRGVRIEGVRCVGKEGGRSGVWREEGWGG